MMKRGKRVSRGCTMKRAALVSALRMPPITDCISNFYLLMSVTMDFNACEYPCLSVFCYSYNFFWSLHTLGTFTPGSYSTHAMCHLQN